MKDYQFKRLNHKYLNFKVTARGQQLVQGYQPDVVLNRNNEYLILECENGTSRKHFLGGLIKAAKFLSGNKSGILVFVILVKPNTNEIQLSNHLKPYLDWVKPLTNLRDIYVISVENYCLKKEVPIELLGNKFLNSSKKV